MNDKNTYRKDNGIMLNNYTKERDQLDNGRDFFKLPFVCRVRAMGSMVTFMKSCLYLVGNVANSHAMISSLHPRIYIGVAPKNLGGFINKQGKFLWMIAVSVVLLVYLARKEHVDL